MKRGPKIKLRTEDGKVIQENTNYYVIDKQSRFPEIVVVKTQNYLDTYNTRYKYISVLTYHDTTSFKALQRGNKSLITFASKVNAKRYLNRLLKSKIRAAKREFTEYLDKVGKLL